jgi:hypothetical protein
MNYCEHGDEHLGPVKARNFLNTSVIIKCLKNILQQGVSTILSKMNSVQIHDVNCLHAPRQFHSFFEQNSLIFTTSYGRYDIGYNSNQKHKLGGGGGQNFLIKCHKNPSSGSQVQIRKQTDRHIIPLWVIFIQTHNNTKRVASKFFVLLKQASWLLFTFVYLLRKRRLSLPW